KGQVAPQRLRPFETEQGGHLPLTLGPTNIVRRRGQQQVIGVGVELAVEGGDHVESPPKRVVVVPLVDEEGEDLGRDAALEEPGEVHLAPYAPRGDLGELEPLPGAA